MTSLLADVHVLGQEDIQPRAIMAWNAIQGNAVVPRQAKRLATPQGHALLVTIPSPAAAVRTRNAYRASFGHIVTQKVTPAE
jgi:hypothetical protein